MEIERAGHHADSFYFLVFRPGFNPLFPSESSPVLIPVAKIKIIPTVYGRSEEVFAVFCQPLFPLFLSSIFHVVEIKLLHHRHLHLPFLKKMVACRFCKLAALFPSHGCKSNHLPLLWGVQHTTVSRTKRYVGNRLYFRLWKEDWPVYWDKQC